MTILVTSSHSAPPSPQLDVKAAAASSASKSGQTSPPLASLTNISAWLAMLEDQRASLPPPKQGHKARCGMRRPAGYNTSQTATAPKAGSSSLRTQTARNGMETPTSQAEDRASWLHDHWVPRADPFARSTPSEQPDDCKSSSNRMSQALRNIRMLVIAPSKWFGRASSKIT